MGLRVTSVTHVDGCAMEENYFKRLYVDPRAFYSGQPADFG